MIVGLGAVVIVALLAFTGQLPFGGSSEEESTPIPAETGTTTPTEAGAGKPAKASKKSAGGKASAGKKDNAKQKKPAKKKKGKAKTPAPAGGGGKSVTDRYLDCLAKTKGKTNRCAALIEGAG